jgi:putative membrane protein
VKRLVYLTGLAGLLLAVVLVARGGFAHIGNAVLSVGWGLIVITAFHLLPLTFSAMAWRTVMRGGPLRAFLQARLLREAVNNLLPSAHIGGDLVGARLLVFGGVPVSSAAGGVIVDKTIEVIAQLLFTGAGLLVLASLGEHNDKLAQLGTAILFAIIAVAGYVAAQRYGLLKLVERVLALLAAHLDNPSEGELLNLHDEVQKFYRDARRCLRAGACHLGSWLTGVGEIGLSLHFMGIEPTLSLCMILESLGQAVRSAGFVVPGALGVQEGGFIVLGAWLGLDSGVALALSLIKRVRELLLGLPALIVWHLIESRRWLARNAGKAGGIG